MDNTGLDLINEKEILYKILTDFELFNDIYKEFSVFYSQRIYRITESSSLKRADKYLIVFIKLDYFLKMFDRFSTPFICGELKSILKTLAADKEKYIENPIKLNELITENGLPAAIEKALDFLKKKLPRRFFDSLKLAQVEKIEIHRIEEQLLTLLSISELNLIMPEIGSLKNRSVKSTLNKFADYAYSIAQSLNKELRIIVSGDDKRLDYRKYGEILKSLLNLLNIIAVYGIEDKQTRINSGKQQCAQIKISIKFSANSLELNINNDGSGAELVESGDISRIKELINSSVSKAEECASSILNVYNETKALNGSFTLKQSPAGTDYAIRIPLKERDIKKTFSIDGIFNPLKDTLKQYIESKGFVKINESTNDTVEKILSLKLDETSAIINIRGLFKGSLILSADSNLLRHLTSQITLDTLKDSELEEYFDDTLAEILNLVIGNSLRKYGDYQNLIIFEPPYTIKSKDATIKFYTAETLSCNIQTSEGLMNLCLVYQINE